MKNKLLKLLSKARDWKVGVFILSAIACISIASAPAPAKNPSNVQFVSPAWVAEHNQDSKLTILDVRTAPLDYISGHIPNAVHISESTFRGPNGTLPVQYWQPEKLQSLFSQAGVRERTPVLVYADGREILGTTMVAYLLERSGHDAVAILDGGFAAYQAAKLPVTKEFPQYKATQYKVKDDPSVRVSLEEVKASIGKPGVAFIDPRPPELFSGEKQIWVRNGHIPGARNIPWPSFTAGESNFHQLKSLDEIKQILAAKGITPDKNIIVTCSTGREATLQYHVVKHLLNYPNVRVYEGSWTEYSSHPELPVETGRDV